MPATVEGNRKTRQTMLTKFGGCEVYDGCEKCQAAEATYKKHMRKIGKKGGKAEVPKGKRIEPREV